METAPPKPIYLFTDFGYQGPYVGQMKAAIRARRPHDGVIDLMHDAPRMRPELAAYLLPAVTRTLPAPGLVVAVVDPGVGGPRRALVVETDRLTFVGPDNGLLSRVPGIRRIAEIRWRPSDLSASFHGRDLFAPVAAALAAQEPVELAALVEGSIVGNDWPVASDRVVYIDAYGNAMTGLSADRISKNSHLRHAGRSIPYARTFSEAPPGAPFWYANSQGLIEIAANRASAVALLSLALGDKILLD